jgi:hypothetical protein
LTAAKNKDVNKKMIIPLYMFKIKIKKRTTVQGDEHERGKILLTKWNSKRRLLTLV